MRLRSQCLIGYYIIMCGKTAYAYKKQRGLGNWQKLCKKNARNEKVICSTKLLLNGKKASNDASSAIKK